MKLFSKIMSAMVVSSIVACSTTCFAAVSATDVITSVSSDVVAANEYVTLYVEPTTWVGVKNASVNFFYDTDEFLADDSDNTAYNFGGSRAPEYKPNYIADSVLNEFKNNFDGSIFYTWSGITNLNYSDANVKLESTGEYLRAVNLLLANGTAITEEDVSYVTGPKTLGAKFKAKENISAGEHTFIAQVILVDDANLQTTFTKEITVTVEGEEPVVDDKIEAVEDDATGALVMDYGTAVDAADKKLAGKYIVFKNAVVAANTLTENTRVRVTYDDPASDELDNSVVYGNSIYEYLGITGEGQTYAKSLAFGIVYEDSSYKADYFTFEVFEQE